MGGAQEESKRGKKGKRHLLSLKRHAAKQNTGPRIKTPDVPLIRASCRSRVDTNICSAVVVN